MNVSITHMNVSIAHMNVSIAHMNVSITHMNVSMAHLEKTPGRDIYEIIAYWSICWILTSQDF